MDFKPLFDKILVKPISAEETIGGLLIPDTSTNLKKGIVVAVGEGKDGSPMTVQVNQTILFKYDDGTPIVLEGEQYLILRENDVWLINKL